MSFSSRSYTPLIFFYFILFTVCLFVVLSLTLSGFTSFSLTLSCSAPVHTWPAVRDTAGSPASPRSNRPRWWRRTQTHRFPAWRNRSWRSRPCALRARRLTPSRSPSWGKAAVCGRKQGSCPVLCPPSAHALTLRKELNTHTHTHILVAQSLILAGFLF